MDTPVVNGKVKNVGQVAAIVYRSKAPSNQRVLWYDTTVTEGCPIKYYDLTTQNWEPLKG